MKIQDLMEYEQKLTAGVVISTRLRLAKAKVTDNTTKLIALVGSSGTSKTEFVLKIYAYAFEKKVNMSSFDGVFDAYDGVSLRDPQALRSLNRAMEENDLVLIIDDRLELVHDGEKLTFMGYPVTVVAARQ